MEFFELIEKRQSIRMFADQPISDEKIQKILEAANRAPSAGNLQAYRITLVCDSDDIDRVQKTFFGRYKVGAQALLIFWANPKESALQYGERGAELYAIQDATIAAAYAQLAVTDVGLATVWVGAFDPQKLQDIFQKPDLIPVVVFPIGYAAEMPEKRPRRELAELVL